MIDNKIYIGAETPSLSIDLPWLRVTGIKEAKNKLPEKYILNENACICFWSNGTKTVSKRHADDVFDKEIGFLFACWQKYNEHKSRNLRKKILSCIKPECMKDFLFEKFRAENNMTVEQARNYLKNLKVESVKADVKNKKRLVTVIDKGETYSTYREFVTNYFPQYENNFRKNSLPISDKEYKLIGTRSHLRFGTKVALIQDIDSKQVYVISVAGIKEDK